MTGNVDQTVPVSALAKTTYWRPAPQLVVLASCMSSFDVGAVAGEDAVVAGPAQELIALGATAVIASLWTVFDDAAFYFSTRLHWEMRVSGVEPLEAFARSKRWLRRADRADCARHVAALVARGGLQEVDASVAADAIENRPDYGPVFRTHDWAAWTYWGA